MILKTEKFSFRAMTEDDTSILCKLAGNEKYRTLLGACYEENKALTHAYVFNKNLYPLASVIMSQDKTPSVAGVIVMTDAGKKAIDINLLLEEEEAIKLLHKDEKETIILDREKEIIEGALALLRKMGIKKAFYAPTNGVSKKRAFSSEGVVTAEIGTKEYPEYQFTF